MQKVLQLSLKEMTGKHILANAKHNRNLDLNGIQGIAHLICILNIFSK